MNCHNLLDLSNLKRINPVSAPQPSPFASGMGGLCLAWRRKLWNKPSMLVRALNPGTLLNSDPRRYPEFYEPQRDRLGTLVGKTPTPRAAEIGVRVR